VIARELKLRTWPAYFVEMEIRDALQDLLEAVDAAGKARLTEDGA
jgi:hypothetical protein